MQILPGSHKLGLINPEHPSGFVTSEQANDLLGKHEIVHLELKAGECALLHNWLLHSSDVNHTEVPRRAFSVCYMNAQTRWRGEPDKFSVIFGKGALALSFTQRYKTSRSTELWECRTFGACRLQNLQR